jgi:hypothetical protein
MQSYHPTEHQSPDLSHGLLHTASMVAGAAYTLPEDPAQIVNEPSHFCSHFEDQMELYADRQTVAQYLDVHPEWFRRCAAPMQVEAIGQNSYALVIGRFGSFGFEVEPKIGLDLLPQEAGVYRIETVPVPDYSPAGYDVDFRAAMELVEAPVDPSQKHRIAIDCLPDVMTHVQWKLDLSVTIQFPRFIHALPKQLVQNTGDRLLKQIVRQVSTRLTRKVMADFHMAHGLLPVKRSKPWFLGG